MTAISSMRPTAECTDEIAFNQWDAYESWCDVFDRIVYFNSRQPDIDDPRVEFIPSVRFPTIREMAIEASQSEGWACLINADIQVHRKLLTAIGVAENHGAVCAISKRHTIPESGDLCHATVTDEGLDVFLAIPDIWGDIARQVPPAFRIGHPVWDTWIMGFFMKNHGRHCADLTNSRVIFHPQHGDRNRVHTIEYFKDDPILAAVRWPSLKIAV